MTVELLVEALADHCPGTRRWAAATLGGMGPQAQAAVPALWQALRHRDRGLRKAAVQALKQIDPNLELPSEDTLERCPRTPRRQSAFLRILLDALRMPAG